MLLQNAEQVVGTLGGPHHSMEGLALDKKVGYVDVNMVKGYLQALCHQLLGVLRLPSDGGSSRRDTAVLWWLVVATNARLLQQPSLHVWPLQVKGLDTENLIISHIQVNQAQRQRRRTYRAHGRINRAHLLTHHLSHIAAAHFLSDLASPAAFPGTHHVRCWVCIEVCVHHMLSAESDVLAAQHTCLRPATLSSSSQRRWLQYLLDRWVFQSDSNLPFNGAEFHSKLLGCVLCCKCAITEGRVVGRKSVAGNGARSLSRGERAWTDPVLQQKDMQGWWSLLSGDCAVCRRM